MVGPKGRESPSRAGVFLIWQPHPVYYAELCYRAHGDRGTLERYREVVFKTAEFMASYPAWDADGQRYVLGPALIPAQESYGSDRARNLNPTFELAYWHWALDTAQKWRQRLGLEREPKWDHVMQRLSRPFMDAPKNRYLTNGHNHQSGRLPLYLPGNGGLLTAVAMMAGGWDGCPRRPAPGFPDNGQWNVRFEGLRRMP